MKFVEEQLYSTVAFAASSTSSLLIGPKSYWITGLGIEYKLNYATGASPGYNQEAVWRGLTSMSLQGGGRPYLKIGSPDCRALYWHQRLRTRGRSKLPDLAGAASQASLTWYGYLPITFGVHPLLANGNANFFDGSAAIAPDPDLTFTVGWGAAGSSTTQTIWGTNVGANTATLLRLTLYGIVPESLAEEPKFYPIWQTSQFSPAQTYSSLQGTVNLTPGFFYRRTTVMTLLGNAAATLPADNRNDGTNTNAISEVGIKTADGRFPLNIKTWDFAQQSQGWGFNVPDDNQSLAQAGGQGATLALGTSVATGGYNPGVGQIDWVQFANTSNPASADPQYGINMNGKNVGAVQNAFTVDASTNVSAVLLHESFNPY